MELNIRCDSEDEQQAAVRLIEARLPQGLSWEKTLDFGRHTVSYEVNLDEDDGVAILQALLSAFPKAQVTGTVISDVEGRDSSWWRTTRYSSVTDPDGTRRLSVSSSVDWA